MKQQAVERRLAVYETMEERLERIVRAKVRRDVRQAAAWDEQLGDLKKRLEALPVGAPSDAQSQLAELSSRVAALEMATATAAPKEQAWFEPDPITYDSFAKYAGEAARVRGREWSAPTFEREDGRRRSESARARGRASASISS